jgi:hypothetical protein
MAALLEIKDSWRTQNCRKGHKSMSGTLLTEAQAIAWPRQLEAEMDARRFDGARGLANFTLNALVRWYWR